MNAMDSSCRAFLFIQSQVWIVVFFLESTSALTCFTTRTQVRVIKVVQVGIVTMVVRGERVEHGLRGSLAGRYAIRLPAEELRGYYSERGGHRSRARRRDGVNCNVLLLLTRHSVTVTLPPLLLYFTSLESSCALESLRNCLAPGDMQWNHAGLDCRTKPPFDSKGSFALIGHKCL